MRDAADISLLALLLLCFLQLLTEFVAGIYALGLLETRVPPEVACVVLLLAPATLLIRPSISARCLVPIGELMLLSRLASLALETPARMLAAGIGTAAFLIFLPGLLARFGNRGEPTDGYRLGLALALTTLVSVFLGAIDSGNPIVGFGVRWLMDGLLAIVAAVLLWIWGQARGEADAPAPAPARASGGWRIVGLCLGMMGVMAILYLGVAVPAVTARWTDGHHLTIKAMTAGAAALFIAVSVVAPGLPARLGARALVAWNLLFLSALGMALWSSRIAFPSESGAYHVFVTHLGNGGPTSQQREVLELVAGKTNVILMGDFNFRPGAEPYRLTLERLDDAWVTARERRVDPPHQDIERRIDHVFLSREAPVARAEYLDAGASDHPAVVVDIDLSEALPQTKEAREQLVAAGWQPRSPAFDASRSGAAARR